MASKLLSPFILAFLTLVGSLSSCTTTQIQNSRINQPGGKTLQFGEVKEKDQIFLYEQFVKDNPRSEFVKEADARRSNRIAFLKSLQMKRVTIEREHTGDMLESAIRGLLNKMGYDIVDADSKNYGGKLTLGRIGIKVLGMGALSFRGYSLDVSLYHERVGLVFRKSIEGLLSAGTGQQAERERAESLIDNVLQYLPVEIIRYSWTKDRFTGMVPILVEWLKSEDYLIRRRAVYIIKELGSEYEIHESLITLLIIALRDKAQLVRIGVCEALAELKNSTSVPPLIDVLKDDADLGVRARAASALGQIKDSRAVEPLIIALGDKGRVPEEAGSALKRITGQDFGTDRIKWQQWWNQYKPR